MQNICEVIYYISFSFRSVTIRSISLARHDLHDKRRLCRNWCAHRPAEFLDRRLQSSQIPVSSKFMIPSRIDKILNYRNAQFKVRMGDWDTSSENEPLPYKEYTVKMTYVHENYTASNLKNNIAICRLEKMVPLGRYPTIATACLSSKFFRPETTLL